MKNLQDEDRRIDINNIFALNRISSSDTVESGQSITIGAEYKKSRKDESSLPEDIFKDMVEWLKRHRLSRHAQAIVRVAGM